MNSFVLILSAWIAIAPGTVQAATVLGALYDEAKKEAGAKCDTNAQSLEQVLKCRHHETQLHHYQMNQAMAAVTKAMKDPKNPLSQIKDEIERDVFTSSGGQLVLNNKFQPSIEKLIADGKLDLSKSPEMKKFLSELARFHTNRRAFREYGSFQEKDGKLSKSTETKCIFPDWNKYDAGLPSDIPCKLECRKMVVDKQKGGLTDQLACNDPATWNKLDAQKNIPSLRKKRGKGNDHWILQSCVYGYFQGKNASERDLNDDAVCSAIAGTEVAAFQSEISTLLAHSSINHYFEVLRMEAVARLMRAHQELVGVNQAENYEECAPFQKGIDEFRNAPMSTSAHERYKATNSADYLKNIKQAAINLELLNQEANGLASIPSLTCNADTTAGGALCSANLEYEQTRPRYQDTISRIHRIYKDYPALAVGRDVTKEIYNPGPYKAKFANASEEEAKALLAETRVQISKDLGETIKSFCSDDPDKGGRSWMELIQHDEITQAVTKKFPQFDFVQKCALDQMKKNLTYKTVAKAGAGVACFAFAAVTGPAAPAVAAVCAGLMGIEAGVEASAASKELSWTAKCREAGGSVCDEKDYEKARSNYENAIENLVMTVGLGVAVEGIGLYKAAASFMEGAQLARVSSKLASIEARAAKLAPEARPAFVAQELKAMEPELDVAMKAAQKSGNKALVGEIGERYGKLVDSLPTARRAEAMETIAALEDAGIAQSDIEKTLNKVIGKGCGP